MASGLTNWAVVKDVSNSKTIERKVLEKVKKMEEKALKKGYRYVKIGNSTEILVPFGKDGKPTKDGKRRIEIMENMLGVSKKK